MNSPINKKSAKRYTLKPTYKPLPSTLSKKESEILNPAIHASNVAPNPTIRASNEDDDLYDPYSDYHDGTLKDIEFEKDPWR